MSQLEALRDLVVRSRISRGWKQQELAAQAGIGFSTLTRIEQGKPPVPTERIMQKIALAFGKHYDASRVAFVDEPVAVTNGAEALALIDTIASRAGLTREQLAQHFGFRRQAASQSDAARAATERKKKPRGK